MDEAYAEVIGGEDQADGCEAEEWLKQRGVFDEERRRIPQRKADGGDENLGERPGEERPAGVAEVVFYEVPDEGHGNGER